MITRKQVGVIFGNMKKGNLKVNQKTIGMMYDTANAPAYEQQQSQSKQEIAAYVRLIVNAIFDKDMEYAQKEINNMEETFNIQ